MVLAIDMIHGHDPNSKTCPQLRTTKEDYGKAE